MSYSDFRFLVVAGLVSLVWTGSNPRPAAAQPRDFDAPYREGLRQLADKCDELGLPDQAAATRSVWVARDPRRHYCFTVPESDPLQPAENADRLVKLWHQRLVQLRRDQSEHLFQLAQRLVEQQPDEAYRLLFETLYENPQHEQARRVLGYRQNGERWLRPQRSERPRVGTIPHPDFGWKRRSYWIVESEHFRITTNHSIDQARQVADRLEELYHAWTQLFFSYWAEPVRLAQRFAGRDVPLSERPKFEVVLFRDRDDYVAQLGPVEPQIAMTIGYYAQRKQTSYFFAGDEGAIKTWFHEASHQFFQETEQTVKDVGDRSNFWLVEALALYMESFRQFPGYATLGGFDADRLQYARYRALNQRFYVPLRELTALGREQLQQHPDIRRLYSQAAGLMHALLDDPQQRYKSAVIAYADRLYAGREDAELLAQLTGRTFEQLDSDYLEFLRVGDDQLEFIGRSADVRNLCLGHTAVTTQGLVKLGHLRELTWLDLTAVSAGDEDLSWLADNASLNQLSLEGTRVGDGMLAKLAGLRQLEELDLSGTAVTDEGLRHLSSLKQLKLLWLTRTGISDQGLMALRSLKQLELLELTGTQTTPTGQQDLKKHLPAWK